jgi:hypothetical protein
MGIDNYWVKIEAPDNLAEAVEEWVARGSAVRRGVCALRSGGWPLKTTSSPARVFTTVRRCENYSNAEKVRLTMARVLSDRISADSRYLRTVSKSACPNHFMRVRALTPLS